MIQKWPDLSQKGDGLSKSKKASQLGKFAGGSYGNKRF
jgi:hypothetical protein